jgi:nucleotide-binding universal stress UspA family protein
MTMLIATGGSPHSRMAARQGGQIAAALGSDVVLLCVADGEDTTDCRHVLAQARALLPGTVSVEERIRHGRPAEEILRESEARDYTYLVLGEKGHHTPMTRFLLGPTAERVANGARVPVLVVKGDPAGPPAEPIRRILVAVSLLDTERAERLLRHVAPIARAGGAEITVLHVMSQLPIPPAGAPADWEADTEAIQRAATTEGKLLARNLQILAGQGIDARPLIRHGLVIEEVLDEAEAGDYDLVVIGGHEPADWLRNLLLENVALQILHRSRRPVLTVHG